MKVSMNALACIIAIGLSNIAVAEIYETKDAQGNTVFTDTPTGSAQKVDLPETNVADAVKEAPHPTPQARAKPTPGTGQATGQATDGDVTVIHDNRNERLERELAEQRPHEVLKAEKRHEVGDAEAIRKVGDVEGVREGAQEKQLEGARPAVHPRGGHRR